MNIELTPAEADTVTGLAKVLHEAATKVRREAEEATSDPGLNPMKVVYFAGYRDGAVAVADWIEKWATNLENDFADRGDDDEQ